MADGIAITAGSGTTILTDDTGASGHAQVMKLAISTDGSGTLIPADTANGLDVDVTRFPGHSVDTFGQLRGSVPHLDIDVNFSRASYTTWVTATTASGGSNTQGSGYMLMATSTTNGGNAKLVSNASLVYEPGGEVFALVTAAWLQAGAAGTAGSCYMRIGMYDTNNGFFLGYENTTFGITTRTGASDTQVAKASFNVDTLVGGAGSKFTSSGSPVAIDLTKINVFRIRFGWLGSAPVRFEVLSPDGDWVLFHIIRQPNSAATPHIQSPDLPITADVKNTGTTTNLQLATSCWGGGQTSSVEIAGTVPHDGIDRGNPIKVGFRTIAHGTNPTAVAAADRTDWLANRAGVPFVMGGHPNILTLKHTTITTAVTDAAIVTVAGGLKIVVTRLSVTLDNASTVFPTVLIGFGATNTPTTTGVLYSHGGFPAGGGTNIGDGSGILGVGADGEDLRITTTGNATGNGLQVTVSYYTIES